jgi:hypothetical protein
MAALTLSNAAMARDRETNIGVVVWDPFRLR